MNHRKQQERAGMALVALVLLITSVFVLMTAGAGELLNTSMRQASRAQSNRRTSYCSYAIMQRALDKLSTNLLYSVDPKESGVWAEDPEMIYELTIYNNYAGTFSNPAPDGKYVPPYMVYVKVKSDYRDYPGRYTSTLFSKAYVGGQASNFPVVGTYQIYIKDSLVDSWYIKKSGAGAYSLVKSSAGRIVTNSIQPKHFNIEGTSTVDQQLYCGPYGNPATVMNISEPPAAVNASRAAAPSPTRVPRFHPPTNPTTTPLVPKVYAGGTVTLLKGNYKSLTVTGGTTLNLEPGEYYFADNITLADATVNIPGVSAANSCDIYVGKTFSASNSSVNWANTIKRDPPELPLTPAELQTQGGDTALGTLPLGPRTLRVFFVGSGAPNFKDCLFTATANSKLSLFAAGKAMKVQMVNSTLCGGLKGFDVSLVNSTLHYHRVVFNDV